MNLELHRCAFGTFFSLIVSISFASEPVVIATGQAGLAPKQPQAAVARNGTVHLTYGVGDMIFHCRSRDQGISFEAPKQAFRVSNLALGMRRGPRIALAENALVVTVIAGKQGKGRDGDLLAWRSTDDGKTWNGPINVNESADSAREGLHGMAAGANGSIWCVWLDLRNKRSEVYASKSVDGGATWQENVCVYRSPDGNVCECCHPSVAVGEKAVHVMFRNSLAGNRDIYVASSKDGGNRFAPAEKIGLGSWKLNACPMDGGMLSVDEKGELATVWRRQEEVFTVSKNGGKEELLGRGEQPWIANSKSGSVIVWTTGREGDLFMRTSGAKQSRRIAEAARDPVVASSLNGERPIIACSESKRDGQTVVMATSIDIGMTKSP
jgi:hypothetical protein